VFNQISTKELFDFFDDDKGFRREVMFLLFFLNNSRVVDENKFILLHLLYKTSLIDADVLMPFLQTLIEKGADMNVNDKYVTTLLYIAIEHKFL